MKPLLITLFVLLAAAPALADEPVGCDKFKWPLDKERATLTGTDLPSITLGERVGLPIPFGAVVALKPFAEVKLPMPPERAPKSPDSFAGFFDVPAPKIAGTYKITLSAEGWIDVVQDGHTVKSAGSAGALGCEGVRKSVKFELTAATFTVELTGVATDTIKLVIAP